MNDDTDEEHALAPDEIAGAASEEQETPERERVRVDDPLQVGIGHVQVFLDRRQRDVDDRRIEDDHELRHADQDKDEPGFTPWSCAGARVAASSLMHRAR